MVHGTGKADRLITNSGAHPSRGRTSWTSKPEREDYAAFVGFFVNYLSALTHPPRGQDQAHAPGSIDLVLGGYSYGSLILSSLPALPEILRRFDSSAEGSAAIKIIKTASDLATETRKRLEKREMSEVTLPFSGQTSQPEDRFPHVSVRYLLVSPLLPPVSRLLSLSLSSPFSSSHSMAALEGSTLASNPTLAVFGSDDIFTSASKLRTWASKMEAAGKRRFEWLEVDGASHFWRERGVEDELRAKIATWLVDEE